MAKRALAVGISGYGFPNDLPNCTRDAEAFGTMLETIYRFDDVRVLKDGEATREGVDRGLEWLFQNATPNDRLVFYFSGHGCRFERSGTIEEALVLPDGRLLNEHYLLDRMENLPPGVFTAVLDCCFSGLDALLIQSNGEIEVARAKRWIPTDSDRSRSERLVTSGTKAFTPFGYAKPVAPEAMAAHLRVGPALDLSPARVIPVGEPQSKGLFVMACLADEVTVASTSHTDGLSPFTSHLLNEIRRRGPNRSAFELLQATGHELRRLGLRQTPLIKQPLQPEHLALRAFLTFQPVLSVYPPQGPGRESDEDLARSIAEAVRTALITMQEGRPMHAMPGAQTYFSEPFAAGGYSPMGMGFGAQSFQPGLHGWQGQPGLQGWQNQLGWGQGGFGQRGPYEEIAQIVSSIVPTVLMQLQQSRFQQPQFSGYHGQMLQPYDIAQIVHTVTPIVASLIQSRGYQGHFGQFMPRAA